MTLTNSNSDKIHTKKTKIIQIRLMKICKKVLSLTYLEERFERTGS